MRRALRPDSAHAGEPERPPGTRPRTSGCWRSTGPPWTNGAPSCLEGGSKVTGRHCRRVWTALSPHSQLIDVLFLNVKLPFCVAEGSRHLQMKRRQMLRVINSEKKIIQKVEILRLISHNKLFSWVLKIYLLWWVIFFIAVDTFNELCCCYNIFNYLRLWRHVRFFEHRRK